MNSNGNLISNSNVQNIAITLATISKVSQQFASISKLRNLNTEPLLPEQENNTNRETVQLTQMRNKDLFPNDNDKMSVQHHP